MLHHRIFGAGCLRGLGCPDARSSNHNVDESAIHQSAWRRFRILRRNTGCMPLRRTFGVIVTGHRLPTLVSGARPRSAKLSPGFSVPPACLVDGGEKNGLLQGLGQEGDGASELAALAGADLVVRGNDDGGDIDAFAGEMMH